MTPIPWEDLQRGEGLSHQAFVEGLHHRGYVLVRAGDSFARTRAAFLKDCRHFFWQRVAYKDHFRTPSSQGYLTPNPGTHEVFEMKRNRTDKHFRIPDPVSASWNAMYDAVENIAKMALELASREVTGSSCLLEHLDDSTFRMIHFDRVDIAPPEQVQTALADHTDSGFLTVASKSTCPALEVLEFESLTWTRLEELMDDDTLALFPGESLSRATNNYFRSLMHRPVAKLMISGREARISAPFFLRGRPDALLDISRCDPSKIGPVDPSVSTPIPLEAIADNLDGARDHLPWKNTPYYSNFRYS